MSNKYLKDALAPPTQQESAEGTVQNSAGGQSFPVDSWDRLTRFLILGSSGGSYYAGQRELTVENVAALKDLAREDGLRFVREVVELSESGRAPKNDPAILALALAASLGDDQTRGAALVALPRVCRTATHLFTFLDFVEQMRGWGRGLRKAVGEWYTSKSPSQLAYQLVKYRQRGGWTHRDVLRLSHPVPKSEDQGYLFQYAVGKGDTEAKVTSNHVLFYEALQLVEKPKDAAALIRQSGGSMTREMVKSEHLTDPDVWAALLETEMPLTAMIRNLGNMTRVGLLTPKAPETDTIVDALADEEKIRSARVHPLAVLTALRTYAAGHGYQGKGSWDPVPRVVDALDEAFYTAFGNVESTGKRIMLALDVSGSMGGGVVGGVPGLTPRDASAAMALVTAATEPHYSVYGFTSSGEEYKWNSRGDSNGFIPLSITPRQRLDDAIRSVSGLGFGGTDCALPMLVARDRGLEIDAFVVYTDSETWAGDVHPSTALQQYRRASGIDTKLIVVGMVSNGFTLADPADPGMLDVVGFDTAVPQVMSEFLR